MVATNASSLIFIETLTISESRETTLTGKDA